MLSATRNDQPGLLHPLGIETVFVFRCQCGLAFTHIVKDEPQTPPASD